MRRRRMLSIAGYWLAQGLVIYAGWPVLFELKVVLHLDTWWEQISDPEYAWRAAALILGLTAMQAAFVRPVLPPRIKMHGGKRTTMGERLGAALSQAASALALSFGLSLVALLAAIVVRGWDVIEFTPSVQVSEDFILFGGMAAGTVVLTPILMWRCRRSTPLWLSLMIAGLAICAMIVALVAAVLEGYEQFIGPDLSENVVRWAVFVPVLAGWPVSTLLLIAFVRRGPRESRLSRIASMIFLGTAVETAAVIPLDVLVRKRSTCYCGEGTFWALMLLGSAGLFALGPAIYLLPFGRRRKRWLQGRCEVCGYDMKATPGARRCPECGSGWRGGAREGAEMAVSTAAR